MMICDISGLNQTSFDEVFVTTCFMWLLTTICDKWTRVEIFALKDWNFEYLSPSSILHTSIFLLILETAANPYFPPTHFKLCSD